MSHMSPSNERQPLYPNNGFRDDEGDPERILLVVPRQDQNRHQHLSTKGFFS